MTDAPRTDDAHDKRHDTKLDGNAAAGDLEMLFPFEVTTMRVTCDGCGMEHMVGEQAAYVTAIGMIVRCASCDAVLIRVMQARGVYRYDMRGVRAFVVSKR